MEQLTDRQIHILKHTLGLDREDKPYRNHYSTHENAETFPDCEALFEMGLMNRTDDEMQPGYIYSVTEEGRKIATKEQGVGIKLFAFWEYDEYPYCLGGEVEEIVSEGKVKVVGYPGFKFTPLRILPYEEGVLIKEELEELRQDYRKAKENLRQEYVWEANQILPFEVGK